MYKTLCSMFTTMERHNISLRHFKLIISPASVIMKDRPQTSLSVIRTEAIESGQKRWINTRGKLHHLQLQPGVTKLSGDDMRPPVCF